MRYVLRYSIRVRLKSQVHIPERIGGIAMPGNERVRYSTSWSFLIVIFVLVPLIVAARIVPPGSSSFDREGYAAKGSTIREAASRAGELVPSSGSLQPIPASLNRPGTDHFIENVGQVQNSEIRLYGARGPLRVGFADSAVVVVVKSNQPAPSSSSARFPWDARSTASDS